MKHEHRPRTWSVLFLGVSLLLTGCATPRPTVPTAVLYDRDRDEFSVEVEPVPEGQTPVYPEELEFVTVIDGERHDGLIPTPSAYGYNAPDHRTDLWRGPWWVEFKDSKWRLQRVRMTLPRTTQPNQPLFVHCHLRAADLASYPAYLFKIEGSHQIINLKDVSR